MRFRDRLRIALRSITQRDFSLRDPSLARLLWGGGSETAAGIAVSEDSALNISAYWRGVNLISSHIAAMPLHFYKGDRHGKKEKNRKSKLYKLLHDRPNPEMNAYTFREILQSHLLTWGNAYAEIEWNQLKQPIALWPLTPDRVLVRRDNKTKRIIYYVAPSNRIVYAEDILHVPGLGFDGLIGYSVIARARQSLGLTAAAERYGASFFGNGASPGGMLTTPDDLDKEQRDELRAEIERLHMGPDRAHRLMVLYNGMTFQKMSLPPNEAQFLETRAMGITDIARWLGVPPHKLYDLTRSTYSNIEAQGVEYYTDTLWGWLERWEQELNFKLVPDLESNYQWFEFDFNGVLRTDTKERYTAYQTGHLGGWLSINEIRLKENDNPIPGGDEYLAPTNMIPLSMFTEYMQAKLDQLTKPKPAPNALPADGGTPGPQPADPTDPTTKKLEAQLKQAQGDAKREQERAYELAGRLDAVNTMLAAMTIDRDRLVSLTKTLEEKGALTEMEKATALAEVKHKDTQIQIVNGEKLVIQRDKERADEQVAEAKQLVAVKEQALEEARATIAKTTSERDAAQALEATTRQHAEALGARVVAVEAERDSVRALITESVEALEESKRAKQASDKRAEEIEAERALLTEELKTTGDDLTASKVGVETLRADLAIAQLRQTEIEADKTSTEQARDAAAASCLRIQAELDLQVAEHRELGNLLEITKAALDENVRHLDDERKHAADLQEKVARLEQVAEGSIVELDKRNADLARTIEAKESAEAAHKDTVEKLQAMMEAKQRAELLVTDWSSRATAAETTVEAERAKLEQIRAKMAETILEKAAAEERLAAAESAQGSAEQRASEAEARAVKAIEAEAELRKSEVAAEAAAREKAIEDRQKAEADLGRSLIELQKAEADAREAREAYQISEERAKAMETAASKAGEAESAAVASAQAERERRERAEAAAVESRDAYQLSEHRAKILETERIAAEQLAARATASEAEVLAEIKQTLVQLGAVTAEKAAAEALVESLRAEKKVAHEEIATWLDKANTLEASLRTAESAAAKAVDDATHAHEQLILAESELASVQASATATMEAKMSAEQRVLVLQAQVEAGDGAAVEAKRAWGTAQAEAVEARAKLDLMQRDYEGVEDRAAKAEADAQVLRDAIEKQRSWNARRMQWRRQGIVEAMRRMVAIEVEQLQRNQVSAEKLRKWVDRFYQTMEERMFTALRCWVGEHLAELGRADDPEIFTRQLVREHIEQSKRDIEELIENSEDEARSAAVYVVTQRWMTERTEAIANRLLEREIEHNGRR